MQTKITLDTVHLTNRIKMDENDNPVIINGEVIWQVVKKPVPITYYNTDLNDAITQTFRIGKFEINGWIVDHELSTDDKIVNFFRKLFGKAPKYVIPEPTRSGSYAKSENNS